MNWNVFSRRASSNASARRRSQRPGRFRLALEPLEDRKLLTVAHWTLDTANSFITLSIPDQDVTFGDINTTLRFRNQTGSTASWTTNTSHITGDLVTDFIDNGSIRFVPGLSDLDAVASGNYRPNFASFDSAADPPAFTDTTTTPGDFGARIQGSLPLVGFQTAAYLNISDLTYDLDSDSLAISGGNFASDAVDFGTLSGTIGLDGVDVILVGQVIPDTLASLDGAISGTNEATGGSITSLGGMQRKLTLPLSFAIELVANPDTPPITGTITGQIVATTTILDPVAPVVDLNGVGVVGVDYPTAWNGSGPVNLADNLTATVADPDDFNLASMSAAISSVHPGDLLAATGTGGISVSYDAGNGVLSMTGTSSVANYQTVLRSITYDNTEGGPGVDPLIVNIETADPLGDVSANAVATVGISAPSSSTVVGRNIFYNQSAYDGTTAASGLAINFFSDNLAIATDKTAYLPGDPKAVAFNITNYTRGINGIIIDLSTTGGTHQSITAADFVFKVGANNTPSSWAAAPATASVAVSLGFLGNDRVEITWASGAISNKWLEVQMLANSRTGLAATDVFFWGNKVADSASGTLDNNNFVTNSTDAAQVFATLTAANGAAITNLRDYNRDKTVNSTDAAIVFAQLGNLNRLLVGGAGPFAPDGGDLGGGGSADGDAGISSALAGGGAASSSSQALPTAQLPTAIRERLEGGGGGSAAIDAALASSLADDDAANDDGADEMDELLDSLAAGV